MKNLIHVQSKSRRTKLIIFPKWCGTIEGSLMSRANTTKYRCSKFQDTLTKQEMKRPMNLEVWDMRHLSSVRNSFVELLGKL